jgi:hypothetical protein
MKKGAAMKRFMHLSIGVLCLSCASAPPPVPPTDKPDEASDILKFEAKPDSTGDLDGTMPSFYDIKSVALLADTQRIYVQVRTVGEIGSLGYDTGYFIEFDIDLDGEIDFMYSMLLKPRWECSLVFANGNTLPMKLNVHYTMDYMPDKKGFVFSTSTPLPGRQPSGEFQWRVSSEVSTPYGLYNDFAPDQNENQDKWFRYDD